MQCFLPTFKLQNAVVPKASILRDIGIDGGIYINLIKSRNFIFLQKNAIKQALQLWHIFTKFAVINFYAGCKYLRTHQTVDTYFNLLFTKQLILIKLLGTWNTIYNKCGIAVLFYTSFMHPKCSFNVVTLYIMSIITMATSVFASRILLIKLYFISVCVLSNGFTEHVSSRFLFQMVHLSFPSLIPLLQRQVIPFHLF